MDIDNKKQKIITLAMNVPDGNSAEDVLAILVTKETGRNVNLKIKYLNIEILKDLRINVFKHI